MDKKSRKQIYLQLYSELKPEHGMKGACKIIGERFHITPNSVYQAVVLARRENKKLSPEQWFKEELKKYENDPEFIAEKKLIEEGEKQ